MPTPTFDEQISALLSDVRAQAATGYINMGGVFGFMMGIMKLAAVEIQQPEENVHCAFSSFLLYHLIVNNKESEVKEIIERLKLWTPDNRPTTMN